MRTIIPNPARQRPLVLHWITHLSLGGAEKVALKIIESLHGEFDFALFAVRGVKANALGQALERQVAELQVPLFSGLNVPMKLGGMIPGGIEAARIVARLRPDLIHVHTEIPEACYATMVTLRPALGRIPLVRTIHNSVYWHFWRPLGRWCDRRMPRAWIAGVSKGAVDGFEQLRRESGAGPAVAPPRVIYNGVSVATAQRNALPRQRGFVRLVFGGRLETQKGTDLLPAILRAFQRRHGGTGELTIFGSGAHERLLRALAAAPPPGWQVRILPPVLDFPQRIQEFDAVLIPSRFEGLALIAIEAIFAGVPPVITDIAGLRETVPDDYPWRARADDPEDFAEALKRACDAVETAPAIMAKTVDFARARFDSVAMAAGYRALYHDALAAIRTRGATSLST